MEKIFSRLEDIFSRVEDLVEGIPFARRLVIIVVGIPLFVVAGISVGIVGGIVNAIAQPYVDDTTLVFIMLGVFFAPLIAYLWIPYFREPPSDAAEFRARRTAAAQKAKQEEQKAKPEEQKAKQEEQKAKQEQ